MGRYHLYTDGACHPNPGVGGWAFLLIAEETKEETVRSGKELNTTNNRMELHSMIEGLKHFHDNIWTGSQEIIAYSDSAYVVNGITDWVNKWVKNNWKVSSKKSVINPDLWQKLYNYKVLLKPSFNHVKGHNGHVENERVDKLAVAARL